MFGWTTKGLQDTWQSSPQPVLDVDVPPPHCILLLILLRQCAPHTLEERGQWTEQHSGHALQLRLHLLTYIASTRRTRPNKTCGSVLSDVGTWSVNLGKVLEKFILFSAKSKCKKHHLTLVSNQGRQEINRKACQWLDMFPSATFSQILLNSFRGHFFFGCVQHSF